MAVRTTAPAAQRKTPAATELATRLDVRVIAVNRMEAATAAQLPRWTPSQEPALTRPVAAMSADVLARIQSALGSVKCVTSPG